MAREIDLGSVIGPKGDPFTYEDFTEEQLAALKGPKGDPGEKGEKGEKGDPGATSADGVSYEEGTVKDALDALKEQMEEVLYEAIQIISFTNNVNTVEMGSTVNTVVLTWKTNKTPTTLTLDGEGIDKSLTTKTIEGANLKSNKTYTLKATDEREATATKTSAITFLNGVYWGVGESKDSFDSAFLLGLTKGLQSGKAKTFTVNAGAAQHIYYALPSRYGTPSFKVGGFEGGFAKAATIAFTNASGYQENYDIWKSDNPGLGNTTVVAA